MATIFILIKQEEIPFSEFTSCEEILAKLLKHFESESYCNNPDFWRISFTSKSIFVRFGVGQSHTFPEQRIVGPKLDAPQVAIEGFYRKYPHEQGFTIRIIEGNYVAIKEEETKTAEEIAPQIVEQCLLAISKSWKETLDIKPLPWCRPIHSISAFLMPHSDSLVPKNNSSPGETSITYIFEWNPLRTWNEAYQNAGLQFDTDEDGAIRNAMSQEKIKAKIHNEINRIERELGITCVSRKPVEELASLYDYPQFQIGAIPQEYLSLPKELLRLTIEKNQRYILFESHGKIVPTFLIVGKKHSDEILRGHIKTLKARLEDASYYIDQDLKTFDITTTSPSLKKITFHEKYGSIAKRVESIKEIARNLFPGDSQLQTAITVSKNDLTTNTVQSFTDLQGYIGGIYLTKLGVNEEISTAVSQHYKPLNPNDSLPQTPLGMKLSLVDKLQKINSLTEVGEIPTSSRDPFAIRRDILSIIRIWDVINPNSLHKISEIIDSKLHGFITERLKLYENEFKR